MADEKTTSRLISPKLVTAMLALVLVLAFALAVQNLELKRQAPPSYCFDPVILANREIRFSDRSIPVVDGPTGQLENTSWHQDQTYINGVCPAPPGEALPEVMVFSDRVLVGSTRIEETSKGEDGSPFGSFSVKVPTRRFLRGVHSDIRVFAVHSAFAHELNYPAPFPEPSCKIQPLRLAHLNVNEDGLGGRLDGVDESGTDLVLVGWAALPERATVANAVLVYVDGYLTEVGNADRMRHDIADTYKNDAITRSGFALPLKRSDAPPGARVRVFAEYDSGYHELGYAGNADGSEPGILLPSGPSDGGKTAR